MKKQNLFALLASLGMLTACGGGGGGGTQPDPVIPHDDPFVTTVENPSSTRNFREDFDLMIEDFSSANPSGTTTGSFTNSVLRVLVDSEDKNEPKTPDASIVKFAKDGLANIDGIGFKIRKVGNKALKLSNLILGLRGDDNHKVYELKLSDAFDPDGDPLNEFNDQFQEIIVSRQQSLDGDAYYQNLDGSESELGLLDALVGFHLYAGDEECSAVVEISELFVTDGAGEKTVLDTFNREKPNGKEEGVWWRDSTGYIQQKGVTLGKGQSYTTKDIEVGEYKNLVVSINGDTTGFTLNGVNYSSLKDDQGTALTGAVNGAFYNYVINFENSGLTNNTAKFTFTAQEGVVISKVFLTNLQNEAPLTEYPQIDIDGAVYFDKFNNRTMAAGTLDGDYDKSAADPATAEAGFNFILSYHGSDKISIADGKLEIANTGESDYAQYKAGSKTSFAGKKYMVISAKGDISLLRIALKDGGEIIYGNQWVAGPGLPTIPEGNYPYEQEDGYRLYIVDLERSGYASDYNDIVDLYYTGEGLSVDSIFFTNEYKPAAKVEEEVVRDMDVSVSDPAYTYVTGIDIPSDVNYLHVETDATVEDMIRFAGDQGDKWLKDGAVIDINGQVVADGSSDYIIDLEASELDASTVHVHSTQTTHAFKFTASTYEEVPLPAYLPTELTNKEFEDITGYIYGGAFVVHSTVQFFRVRLSSTTAGQNLNSIRFGGKNGDKWIKDKAIFGKDGQPIPGTTEVTEEGIELVIDAVASGLKDAVNDEQLVHLHLGGFDGSTGNVTITIEEVTIGGSYIYTLVNYAG